MMSIDIKVNGRLIYHIEAQNIKTIAQFFNGFTCKKDVAEYVVKSNSYLLQHDRIEGLLMLSKKLLEKEIKKGENECLVPRVWFYVAPYNLIKRKWKKQT